MVVSILERERKGWCLRCHGLNTLLLYCVTFVTDGNAIFFRSIQHAEHPYHHGLFRARHEGGEGGEGGLPDEEEGVVVVDDDDDGERRGGRGGRVHLERASDVGTHEEHDFVVIIIIIIILVDDDDDDDAVENVERSVDENERSGRFSLGRKSVESDERIKRRDS